MASDTIHSPAIPEGDGTHLPDVITGLSPPVPPEPLQQFTPFSERQQRFIEDFQRVTNRSEWPSVIAMRALEVKDARTNFVTRRRSVLDARTTSIHGIIKASRRRKSKS